MPRGKAAFIVEGELEKDFLDKHCGNKLVVRKIPSNGDDVAVTTLATMILAIYGTLRNPTRVVVILDRENRDASSGQLEQQLLALLQAGDVTAALSVHIADRMIENWIIADPQTLASESLHIDISNGTEGNRGKALLKQAFRAQGQAYSERVDGVRLLGRSRASVLAQHSESFFRLYQALKESALPCAWIAR